MTKGRNDVVGMEGDTAEKEKGEGGQKEKGKERDKTRTRKEREWAWRSTRRALVRRKENLTHHTSGSNTRNMEIHMSGYVTKRQEPE